MRVVFCFVRAFSHKTNKPAPSGSFGKSGRLFERRLLMREKRKPVFSRGIAWECPSLCLSLKARAVLCEPSRFLRGRSCSEPSRFFAWAALL